MQEGHVVHDAGALVVDQRADVPAGLHRVDRAVDVTHFVLLEADEVLARVHRRAHADGQGRRGDERAARAPRHAHERDRRHREEDREALRDEPDVAVALRQAEIEVDARERQERVRARDGLALVGVPQREPERENDDRRQRDDDELVARRPGAR